MPYREALREESLPEGHAETVWFDKKPIAIFHTEEGWFAIDSECPHRGAPLHMGTVEEGVTVLCPLHFWTFDLRNGECTDVPGECVSTYPVRVREGIVEVDIDVQVDEKDDSEQES